MDRHVTHVLALCIALSLGVLAFGCARTRFAVDGAAPALADCRSGSERLSTLVLWRSQWRTDQKDVPDREAAAERGITRFFTDSSCFSPVTIRRLPAWLPADDKAEEKVVREGVRAAKALKFSPERVIVLTVRELGPVLHLFCLPALVEGGTEVALDIRILHGTGGETLADFRARWQHGGPWVIKGVGSLEQDMASALTTAFTPQSQAEATGAQAH